MGAPSAATKAARSRAAAKAADAPETPAEIPAATNHAVAAALAVLGGVTSDAVQATAAPARNVAGRRKKVTLPAAAEVAVDITAAAVGALRAKNDFTSGAKGFFASAKSSFGDIKYQITLSVVLIGSSPKSGVYDKSRKVTIDLPTAAAHVANTLPASLTATVFKGRGSDGFRINGRFHVSENESYMLTGTAVRTGSATK